MSSRSRASQPVSCAEFLMAIGSTLLGGVGDRWSRSTWQGSLRLYLGAACTASDLLIGTDYCRVTEVVLWELLFPLFHRISIVLTLRCLWSCRGTVYLSLLLKDVFILSVPAAVSVDTFNQGSLGSDSDDHHDVLIEGISGNGSFLFRFPLPHQSSVLLSING